MERVDTIMGRLGFKKESDDGTKAAFVKNLIKQAYGVEVKLPPQYELMAKAHLPQTMEELGRDALDGKPLPQKKFKASTQEGQLSFNFEKPEAG
jgi:hypothetical protein